MLLRDSEVAKEVRNYLLNVEEVAKEKAPEVIHEAIDKTVMDKINEMKEIENGILSLYVSEQFTTTKTTVNLYNRNGESLGTIEAGSKVLVSYNLPFASGHEDPSKFRVVGYIPNGFDQAERTRTLFIDGFKDGFRTIATRQKIVCEN